MSRETDRKSHRASQNRRAGENDELLQRETPLLTILVCQNGAC
jgi:hypothetical protein